ncbi:hypothetical protein [Pectobacterium betavasculorum]|uniref:Uncharacterized protein n=1 Tax=Pectobacterium betavasculorum TaxID=55207 RepID=A0ABR4UZ49_9GAMM|nr:hypothetical protein [Pectobacterium betavasculorum]KFX19924.1 hypothetical protein JV35_10675 [Pectobacterium betavasculorum]
MSVEERWGSLKKAKKWFWGLVTPTVIITSVSLTFNWVFLFRIGREDLFMQVATLRDLFSTLAFFSIISILLYLLVFFMQSLVSVLILRRTVENFEDYKIIKSRYLFSFIACSILSSMILFLISYYFPRVSVEENKWLVPAQFLLVAIINIIICFFSNRNVIRKKTCFMTIKEKRYFYFRYHILHPFLLGLASWCFVFPLGLLLRFVDFSPDTSLFIQVISLSGLTVLIVLFSIIPGSTYLWLPISLSISKQILSVTVAAIVAIVFSSIIAPVIPVQMINLSMKLSGITKYDVYNYAVAQEQYPIEMFESKNWFLKESNNKKFFIFKGFSIYTIGSISLVCPENVSGAISKSMKFIFLNSDYDKKLRDELSASTAECNVINQGEFKSWKRPT